jgi:hypothetical protein
VPTLKGLKIFDSVRNHGYHDQMGGLFREASMETCVGNLNEGELQDEIYRKPCFIFGSSTALHDGKW